MRLSRIAGLVFEAVVRGDRTRPTEDTKALTDAQRAVNLRFPVTRNPQGEEMTTLVTMKRLSGERDMLPR